MNECPFCGSTLDCNSNDVWICHECKEVWLRLTLEVKILKILFYIPSLIICVTHNLLNRIFHFSIMDWYVT
jgi:heterodisulfide reductase subunit C